MKFFVVFGCIALTLVSADESGSVLVKGEHTDLQAALPPDNGVTNWGDLVYGDRVKGDVLLASETIIYPHPSPAEQTYYWYYIFNSSRKITSVRVLNFGRQRAFGSKVDVYDREVDVTLRIPPNVDPRVIVEIYGY